MAAQVAPVAPAASSADNQDVFAFFVASFKDITEQLANGVRTPTVSFTKISALGVGGIDIWKSYIEGAAKARFEFGVNAAANAVTLTPIESMPPEAASLAAETPSTTTTLASPQTAGAADCKDSPKDKVSRPPNAFIIYRQDWHPKVAKEHPDIHNNDISVIIGRMWKAETEAVRAEYKRKAEDAKRQHAIDHPGYQYQPRKPSEKKKRMTKNKLAKLRAQANAAIAPDPMKDLNEMLAKAANDTQVTVDTFQAPHRQGFPNLQPSQEVNNHLTFDADGEHDMLLYNQLTAWNAANPCGVGEEPAALVGHPLAGGQKTIDVPQHEVPYSSTQVNDIYENTVSGTIGASAMGFHDATVEVERQDCVCDGAMSELFNFEAYAESALQDFQGSYLLDL